QRQRQRQRQRRMSVEGRTGEDGGLPPRMTLRVYTVDRTGRVTSDSGTHGFEGGDAGTATSLGQEFPACVCPHHRVARTAR
ncbi:hypothetical protein, partial [Streptomyces adelaidensis]|uniref:hypothetical protein n=1 Tax=Streptomyces adelaidensis TaxID=2796465 RepID=UPI001F366A69